MALNMVKREWEKIEIYKWPSKLFGYMYKVAVNFLIKPMKSIKEDDIKVVTNDQYQ